ncbi:MAG: nitronate monooxygenase [Anaerolineae bacterium]
MVYPKIIQGGMGVAISTWQLAQAVSCIGQLGVVSGTGIGIILIARLMDGDKDGHMRRALAHFPQQDVAQRIINTYYIEGGKPTGMGYKRPTMWTVKPSASLEELTVVANFAEVWLAKEGHNNPVGINLLEKVQMPTMASLYGAMLAGVDYVIMGAGIPTQIPGILDSLARHEAACYRLDVIGHANDIDTYIYFNCETSFSGLSEKLGMLKRPLFLPIVSSVALAMALLKRSSGEVNGFIVELPSAGGHNAPPRNKNSFNELGEPLYTEKDAVDINRIAALGLPFWLAGGYGTAAKLQEALVVGAQGIQVGTAFAFCDESGMTNDIKTAVISSVKSGMISVFTDPVVSPTGFPFKVVQLEGTISDTTLYKSRPRICDIGYLRQIYSDEAGTLGYRCAAEPIDTYLKKGGELDATTGRKCLCNHLGAAAGYPQVRSDGAIEPALVTAGDALVDLGQFLGTNATHYSAADVIKTLLAFSVR